MLTPAFDSGHAPLQDVQDVIHTGVKFHDETMVQRVIDDGVEKKFFNLFKVVHNVSLTGTYTELY